MTVDPRTCPHDDVATGYVNDDTETYCAVCGLVLTVNGVDEPALPARRGPYADPRILSLEPHRLPGER